jgi:hypothetical protein
MNSLSSFQVKLLFLIFMLNIQKILIFFFNFKVDSNDSSLNVSSITPKPVTRMPVVNNMCQGCATVINGQVKYIFFGWL